MHARRGHVQLTSRAERDLRQLERREREQIAAALRRLLDDQPNLDLRPIVGVPGWWRLRVGDYRVLCRPMTQRELERAGYSRGSLIARVVNRRELERAVRSLARSEFEVGD